MHLTIRSSSLPRTVGSSRTLFGACSITSSSSCSSSTSFDELDPDAVGQCAVTKVSMKRGKSEGDLRSRSLHHNVSGRWYSSSTGVVSSTAFSGACSGSAISQRRFWCRCASGCR